jgi:hypothetical protein
MRGHDRSVYADQNDTSVQLTIERLGYIQKSVLVTINTVQLSPGGLDNEAGLTIYPAVQGEDFIGTKQTVVLQSGMVTHSCLLDYIYHMND